ncbi:MAG: tyrosine-type recombinase/integrase [Gammaproteobacteria bacterium]|nr:tyrosine-type recombinase/integrase [Gammaproteobacteria bacterium]MBQ0773456.1 tyrosine-type recombinase/integrase [Gammaproteobacteria bacterium]
MSSRSQATTEAAIKHAKPEAKPYKMAGGQGMYLLVNPAGSKLWRMKYRFDGKEKTLSIGAYPDVTLAQARLRREKARQQLAEGVDPNELLKEQRQLARAKMLTFKVVAERWYHGKAVLAKKPWALATAEKARLYLDKDIYPALGGRPIADITRIELIKLNESIEKRGAFDIAKKIRQWLGAIFDDALDRGEIQSNPAHNLKPSYRAEGAETKHHPAIRFNELPAMLSAVDDTGSHKLIKLAIRLLMLTAVRPAELRLARWSEFDLDAGAWTIPAERMKMRRAHSVPLTQQVLDALQQVKAINHNGYLFAIRGGQPISENTINKTLKLAGYGGKHTGHGFRHLLSTELNERGYNRDWIETQLAHTGEDKIRATYNKAQYVEQRQQMMQEWADSIDALVAGAHVVAFKRGRA